MKSKKIKLIAITAIASKAGDILLKLLDFAMVLFSKLHDALQK